MILIKYVEALISLTILNQIKYIFSHSLLKANFYSKINDVVFFDESQSSSHLLSSFDSISILKCLTICSQNSQCFYIVYTKKNQCYIWSMISFSNDSTKQIDMVIYKKKFVDGLINYWSFNGNVNDSIGDSNMYDGVNAGFTYDRFGIENSALSLTKGYYKIPPGIYFNGTQFTIMAWVKLRSFQICSRLFDFGKVGPLTSNEGVYLSLSFMTTGRPYLSMQSGIKHIFNISPKTLKLNQWQHLTLMFSFPFYSIYIDGIEATIPGSKTSYSPFSLANVVRDSNFIGRSNWFLNGDKDVDADFDDLKIFNRALTQKELQLEMTN